MTDEVMMCHCFPPLNTIFAVYWRKVQPETKDGGGVASPCRRLAVDMQLGVPPAVALRFVSSMLELTRRLFLDSSLKSRAGPRTKLLPVGLIWPHLHFGMHPESRPKRNGADASCVRWRRASEPWLVFVLEECDAG